MALHETEPLQITNDPSTRNNQISLSPKYFKGERLMELLKLQVKSVIPREIIALCDNIEFVLLSHEDMQDARNMRQKQQKKYLGLIAAIIEQDTERILIRETGNENHYTK